MTEFFWRPDVSDTLRELKTVGDVARGEGVPAHRVAYAIETYHIEPTQRAGILRLYDESKIVVIRSALRRIAKRSGALA